MKRILPVLLLLCAVTAHAQNSRTMTPNETNTLDGLTKLVLGSTPEPCPPVRDQRGKYKSGVRVPLELAKLRDEYVQSTCEYKESLGRLKVFYESEVTWAELHVLIVEADDSEGMADAKRKVTEAKSKLAEINRQIDGVDQQIRDALDDSKLMARYEASVGERADTTRGRVRAPCAHWKLTTWRSETSQTISTGYKFVCRK